MGKVLPDLPSSCWKRPLPKPKGVNKDEGVVKEKKKDKKEKKDRKEKKDEKEISPKLVPVKKEDEEEFPDKSWIDYNAEAERQHYKNAELSPTEPPDDDEENERLNQKIQAALQDSLLFCLVGKTCFKVIVVGEMISM